MIQTTALTLLAFLPIIHGSIGDVCPDGWERFHGSCYIFEDELLVDWAGAAQFCAAHHQATLAVIESREEDMMLTDHLHKLYKPGSDRNVFFWLGATDDDIEGLWKWYTNDKSFSSGYVNWFHGQPTNYQNQDCLNYWGPENFIGWHDHHCEVKAHAICEKNMTAGGILQIVG